MHSSVNEERENALLVVIESLQGRSETLPHQMSEKQLQDNDKEILL